MPSKTIVLGVAVALIAHEGARTYFDPGDTTRDAIPLAAVPVSSSADTGYYFVTDAITDVEFSKPVPERPTLTIKSS